MALTTWPSVLEEYATIAKLQAGASICRYGDGECKLMRDEAYVREPANAQLAAELRTIIARPDSRCLVGIPTMDKRSPKYANWRQRQAAFLPFLAPKVPYVSAFLTRPDSAPWILTESYAASVEQLWAGKKVALVCEPTNKLVVVVKSAARKVDHLACPSHGASAHIDAYERHIVRGRPDLAILAHGVSATVLAHRLACHGIQTLDLGSIGGMLARLLYLDKTPRSFPAVVHHPDCGDAQEMRDRLEACGFTVLYCAEKSDA